VFVIGEVFGRVGAGEEGFRAVGRDDLVFGECDAGLLMRSVLNVLLCVVVALV